MLLIEPDKRSTEWAVKLAYAQKSDERFYVPKNVYILGMMNTADRSLAVVDYALRRRFAFVTVKPAFEEENFRQHLSNSGVAEDLINKICERMDRLNEAIAEDTTSLGPGFCIGHSFFCAPPKGSKVADLNARESNYADWYEQIIDTEIGPLLEEYWFDAPSKAMEWRKNLMK